LLSNFRSITVPSTNTILHTLILVKSINIWGFLKIRWRRILNGWGENDMCTIWSNNIMCVHRISSKCIY